MNGRDDVKNSREFDRFAGLVTDNSYIDPEFLIANNVKRGLRYRNGTGVVVGATKVSSVQGYDIEEGKKIPKEGQLFYRGIEISELIRGAFTENRMGFEETCYLILFGKLPTKIDLEQFNTTLDECRELPEHFAEDVIIKIPSKDIMNKLQRTILTLYSYDDEPDDTSLRELLYKIINLMAKLPLLIAYSYMAKEHYYNGKSLVLHRPKLGVGTAENILHLTRPDSRYTPAEAALLDLCLIVHADHGGGNNSAFASSVVASSGTDYYSALCTAVGSLKGPKHGGANKKVNAMIADIKENLKDWTDEEALKEYLLRMFSGEVFDQSGLVYGMGHAVYTISDPRTTLLKKQARYMAEEKGCLEEYQLIENIENIARAIIRERKGPDFQIPANVDLYSGLVYRMLGIDEDLFTPIFACARIAGWSAHILEQIRDGKIMRPAYITMDSSNVYVPLADR